MMVRCRGVCVPNKEPAVYRMKKVLNAAPEGVDIILLGDLNVWLRDLRDKR